MDISHIIRQLLKTKCLTQKELAKKIGFSIPAFSRALQKGDFKISVLQKIAEVLDVPICYFFKNNDDDLLNIFKKLISFDVEYVNGATDFANRDRTKKVPLEIMIEKITTALTNSGRTLKYHKLTDKELKLLLKTKYISEDFLSYIIDMLYDDE